MNAEEGSRAGAGIAAKGDPRRRWSACAGVDHAGIAAKRAPSTAATAGLRPEAGHAGIAAKGDPLTASTRWGCSC